VLTWRQISGSLVMKFWKMKTFVRIAALRLGHWDHLGVLTFLLELSKNSYTVIALQYGNMQASLRGVRLWHPTCL
jgi:hypothetical protein